MADTDAPVVVVGAGGHARVVAEAVGQDRVVGHLSPTKGEFNALLGPRLGDDKAVAQVEADGHSLAIGVGFVDRPSAERRSRLIKGLGAVRLATVVHQRAIVAPSAQIGAGAFVAAGAVIGTNSRIGRASIVNTGSVVDHDCQIGANVHIGPGAVLSGDVEVGDDSLIGVGATVRQGVHIGRNVIIGAGAAVIADILDGDTAVGVPARSVDK